MDPYSDVVNVFREHAGGDLPPDAEEVVRAIFEMTIQPTLATREWADSRDWALKQFGKIARHAGGDANGNGGSITAQSLMDAANVQIPKMHDACEELLGNQQGKDYGIFCQFYEAF